MTADIEYDDEGYCRANNTQKLPKPDGELEWYDSLYVFIALAIATACYYFSNTEVCKNMINAIRKH